MNLVRDLWINRHVPLLPQLIDDGRVGTRAELFLNEESYQFRFGKCDDFATALKWVKKVPKHHRAYEPDNGHRWTVIANDQNLALLCTAFDNFREARMDKIQKLGWRKRRKRRPRRRARRRTKG